MGSTKWTHRIERDFASNYLIFLKILFQFKNLYLNAHIRIFRKRWSFI